MKAVDLTRTGQDCTHCRNMLVASILWPMKMFLAKTETNLCCTWWRLHHRDWNKSLRGLAPLYLAKLYRPVFHLIGRWSLWSAASGKLDMQQTATAVGRYFRSWDLEQFTSWTASVDTVSVHGHLCMTSEWHVPAARLILLKAALFTNITITIIIENYSPI